MRACVALDTRACHPNMNGTNAASNGSHYANGSHDTNGSHPSTHLDENQCDVSMSDELTERGLDRHELVRIIVQAVDALGYTKSARTLEEEAGVEAMSLPIRRLRECVLQGKWHDLENVLSHISVFKSDADARAARFVLYEQKFLELLEAGHTADALQCLRNDLTRFSPEPKLLHKLPLLCMCSTPEEVREHAKWPGTGGASRIAVLEKLHKYLPSHQLLQENRLENLLCQTIELQKRQTMYPYTRQRKVSLLEDMEHCESRVPREILHRLEGHTDEVWFVQFSHKGEYLASASKDATVIIWKCLALQKGECDIKNAALFKLKGHSEMIWFLSWSPNDKKLLSCGNDRSIRLWDIRTGKCTGVFEKHTEQITACAWMPHGQAFVSGGHDRNILEWNVDRCENVASYPASAHVNDLTISKDGKLLIATCSNNMIQLFDTSTKQQISFLEEAVGITSMFLSNDANCLLVNTTSTEDPEIEDPEIHIWDISKRKISRKLKGFRQTKYVIRGCFGGHNQMLVLCGSEDHLVYIWERRSGKLLAQLEGHHGTVNTVACNESNEDMFASGSDDKSVIVSLFICALCLLNGAINFLTFVEFVVTCVQIWGVVEDAEEP